MAASTFAEAWSALDPSTGAGEGAGVGGDERRAVAATVLVLHNSIMLHGPNTSSGEPATT